MAELWAIVNGLRQDRKYGFQQIMVESDSDLSVKMANLMCLPDRWTFSSFISLEQVFFHQFSFY